MEKNIKAIFILTTFFVLVSCSSQTETEQFDSIDYSSYFGFFKSVKILKSGETYVYNNGYYCLKLNKSQLDSISNMVKSVSNLTLDTIINQPEDCRYGISFCLIITSKNRKIITSFHGDPYSKKELEPLFNFMEYLNKLSKKTVKSSDSTFVFESINKLILPPPPPRQCNELK